MMKPWADQPFSLVVPPKDVEGISPVTVKVATEMSLAHNLIIRNLNAIYLQAEGVKQVKDIADFIIFCQIWYEAIHHHHSLEEQYFFPLIEEYSGQKGIMETNLEQHRAFESGVDALKEYVYSATPDTYDGKTLKGIIDAFAPPLVLHLSAEIGTLLALDKYGADKLSDAWALVDQKWLETVGDKSRALPSGLGAMDRTYEGGKYKGWPPLPFFVPYLVNYFYSRKYKGSWRFSPCTIFGEPRELAFIVDVR